MWLPLPETRMMETELITKTAAGKGTVVERRQTYDLSAWITREFLDILLYDSVVIGIWWNVSSAVMTIWQKTKLWRLVPKHHNISSPSIEHDWTGERWKLEQIMKANENYTNNQIWLTNYTSAQWRPSASLIWRSQQRNSLKRQVIGQSQSKANQTCHSGERRILLNVDFTRGPCCALRTRCPGF